MDLFGRRQITVLARERADLVEQNLDLVEELKKRTESRRSLESDLALIKSSHQKESEELRIKIEKLGNEIQEAQNKWKKESEHREKLEFNIRDLKVSKDKKVQELNSLKETFEKEKKSWLSFESQLKEKTEELVKINAEKTTFQQQLSLKNEEISKVNAEKTAGQGKIKELSAEVAAEKKKAKENENQVKKVNDLLGKAENEKKALVGDKAKLEKEIEKLRNEANQAAAAEKAKLEPLQSKIADLETAISNLKKLKDEEKLAFDKREKEAKDQVVAEQGKNLSLEKQYHSIQSENASLSAKLKEYEEEIQKLQKLLENEKKTENSEHSNFENTKKQLEEKINQLSREKDEVNASLLEKENSLLALKRLLDQRDNALRDREMQTQSLKQDLDKKINENHSLAEQIKTLEGKVHDFVRLNQENSSLSKKIKELEAEEKASHSGLDKKTHEIEEANKEKAGLEKRIHELEASTKDNAELHQQLKALEGVVQEKANLEKRVKELESLASELDQLKEKLKKSESDSAEKQAIEKRFKELEHELHGKDTIIKTQEERISELSGLLSSLNEENRYEYDFIIRIDNFFDICEKTNGWEVLTYDESIVNHKQTTLCSILGQYDRGKTFLLDKLTNNRFGSGKKVDTAGISFKDTQIKDKFVVFADTPGFNSPLNSSNHDSLEKKLTETFVQEFSYRLSQYFLIVVNDYTSKDQKLVHRLEKRIKNERKIKDPCIIVLHNFKQVASKEQFDKAWHNQVASLLEEHHSSAAQSVNVELQVKGQAKSHSVQIFRAKRAIHCSIVDDRSEFGSATNLFTFEYIKSLLASGQVPAQQVHLLDSMHQTVSSFLGGSQTVLVPLSEGPHAKIGKRLVAEISDDLEGFKKHVLRLNKLDNFSPAVDRYEQNGKFYVVADIPGIPLDSITRVYKDKYTRLSGNRRPAYQVKAKDNERKFGEFVVEIGIPEKFNNKAESENLENGVLTLVYKVKAESSSSSSESED